MNQSYPHRMRLREPWNCQRETGRARCRRRFGYPGRIDDYERVWLVFAGVNGRAEVALNGQTLGRRQGRDGPFEFDVTSLLGDRNELVMDIEVGDDEGKLWDEVAMEVRCRAWLKDVRVGIVEDNGERLVVDGVVIGSSEGPLELYVVLDRTPLIYTTVMPMPEGVAIHLRSEPLAAEVVARGALPVRVELVHGAVAWYSVDTIVGVP
jgi:hypothetical protein